MQYAVFLKSKFLSNNNEFDPAYRATMACDEYLVANAPLTLAVNTDSGAGAACHMIKPLVIHGCRHRSDGRR